MGVLSVTSVDGTINQSAYAITKHYDPQFENDNIETVTLVDGFGRPIQVKKDAYNQPPTRMYYDALDRVTKTVLPDGATTEMTYGIAGGYFKTMVKDAL